jgi:hypothetical protein
LLGDTPRPVLCTGDTTAFSPSRATLTVRRAEGTAPEVVASGGAGASETGEGGAVPEEPGGAVEELPMAIVAENASGQPRDTVSIRVQVCGPQALVDLKPAQGAEGFCESLTSTQLQCSTSANGIARFFAVHGKRGGGTTQLCALSGGKLRATATITVGDVVVEDLELRVAAEQIGFGSDARLSCSEGDPPQDCGERGTRSASVRVAVLDAVGAEAPVATAQEVALSVRDLSGRPDAVGLALGDCSMASPTVMTTVAANGSTSEPVLLCLDARRSAFELTAEVAGKTRTQSFGFEPVPRSVRISSTAEAAMGGARAVEHQRLELLDCDDRPLPNRPFVWQAGTQPAQPATTDALGSFVLPELEGVVTVGVADGPNAANVIRCQAALGGGS